MLDSERFHDSIFHLLQYLTFGACLQVILGTVLALILYEIEWFNAGVSLWSIIIADIWNWTALPFLIVYSGRVSLPPAVYEAAKVDGASDWLVLRRITLPMLKEVSAVLLGRRTGIR